jgi:hypothetical protein
MDTETVLQIINMLDTRIAVIEESFVYDPDSDVYYDAGQQIGKQKALEEFRDHLQNYVEGQVNQAEDRLGD